SPGTTSSIDIPQAVAVDAAGNVLIVSTQFAPGASPDAAFYVTKLDPAGNTIWSRAYGKGSDTDSYRLTAATDAAGDLFVAGEIVAAGDFGGVPLSVVGSGDAFVLALDPNGDGIWGRTFGSPDQVWQPGVDGPGSFVGATTGASSVAVDAQGNVLLAGALQ